REEVVARLGNQKCEVKTLDSTHLYCEPPEEQPLGTDESELPRLQVSDTHTHTHTHTQTPTHTHTHTNYLPVCVDVKIAHKTSQFFLDTVMGGEGEPQEY